MFNTQKTQEFMRELYSLNKAHFENQAELYRKFLEVPKIDGFKQDFENFMKNFQFQTSFFNFSDIENKMKEYWEKSYEAMNSQMINLVKLTESTKETVDNISKSVKEFVNKK